MTQQLIQIDLFERNGVTVARLTGDLTGPSCEEVSEQLSDVLARRGSRMVIDMAAVKLVSSAGLSALVGLTAQANLQESRVVLACLSPFVANVLEMTRLIRFFETAASIETALELAAASVPVG